MAALNYLALCNKLIQKCGISGGDLATVVNQTGEASRVVNWINEAYTNIQELQQNWQWMRGPVSFNTVAQQANYTPAQAGIADFARWREDSFRCYLTSVGVGAEIFLGRLDWEDYRNTYLYNNIRNTYGQPLHIAVGDDKSLYLGLIPDTIYTVVGEYWQTPTDLALDADVPAMPARFQMLIVYEAMKSYAMYEAAAEVMAEAERQFKRMYNRLLNDQLSRITVGEPLA